MDTVQIDDVENSVQPAAVMKRLTDALSLTDLAMNDYELDPATALLLPTTTTGSRRRSFISSPGPRRSTLKTVPSKLARKG